MNAQAREFVTLYMAREGCTEKAAIAFLKMLDQRNVPEVLSKLRLEALGQRRLDVGPAPLTVYRERSKKVSYSLLLPPDMLEAVKDAADRDGSSASQFIRTAIARQLGRVK